MLPKRKRPNNKNINDLVTLINYQNQIIKKLSEKVSNLESQQKLLEEIFKNKLNENNEQISDIKEIITNSKLEIIKSVNKIDKKFVTSIKNISSEISNLDKEVRLLLLNSVMEQL